MKGEEIPSHARWGGNPAVEMPEAEAQPGGTGGRTPPSVDSTAAAATVN
ncbi:phosphopantetheine-binding protein [Streptomyces hirsutus]